MRRNVPALETCLPVHVQLLREKRREARAVATKQKLSKTATHAMDLYTFQLAAAAYSAHYLSYCARAVSEHAAYVHRLSQHWSTIPCLTLLMYDQAVREDVYLDVLTFATATETQELWLRLVMPDILRSTTRPQTLGGYGDQSPDDILHVCPEFLQQCCTFTQSDALAHPCGPRTQCPRGVHFCPEHGGKSDWSIGCQACAQIKRAVLSAASGPRQAGPAARGQRGGRTYRGNSENARPYQPQPYAAGPQPLYAPRPPQQQYLAGGSSGPYSASGSRGPIKRRNNER
jgi:hypothetical protein